jgi:hypothetical protein
VNSSAAIGRAIFAPVVQLLRDQRAAVLRWKSWIVITLGTGRCPRASANSET